MSETTAASTTCPFCFTGIDDPQNATACPACRTSYHCECWQENGGCAVYGCTQVPVVESRRGIEVPVSYWGQENKPCPSCHQQILAAALRCRHCGVTFASARPENTEEFQSRTAIAAASGDARNMVRWIFLVSILPFTAPVGAVWGWWWHRANRDSVQALPAIYSGLMRIGFIVSLVLTGLIAGLTTLFIILRVR